MENKKIRPLAEGGVLTGITVVLTLFSLYVPLLGALAAFILPLPTIVLVTRQGVRLGLLSVACAGVLLALLSGPLQALNIVIVCGFIGVVMGWTFRKQMGAVKSLLYSSVSAVLSLLVTFAIAAAVLQVNPFNMQLDFTQEMLTQTLDMYRQSGMSEEQLAQMEQQFNTGIATVKRLLPTTIVLAELLLTYINFAVAGLVLRRLKIYIVPALPRFAEWRFRGEIVYIYLLSLVGMYWGSSRELSWLLDLALNANLLMSFFGFLQGTALIYYAAERFHLSKIIRGIILILLLISGMFQILAIIGLFDIIIDYRKRFAKRQ